MKKLLFVSAIFLGAVTASRAGVDFRISLPLPPVPHVVIGHPPPPRVIVHERPRVVISHPPVYVAPPVCAPPVVYAPPPRVIYAPRYSHRGHRHGHYHCRHGRYNHCR